MNAAPTTAPSKESRNENSREEMSPLNGRFITPGRNCDAKSWTGTNRLKATPSANPVSVNLSGSSLVSASVKISPSTRKPNVQYFNVDNVVARAAALLERVA